MACHVERSSGSSSNGSDEDGDTKKQEEEVEEVVEFPELRTWFPEREPYDSGFLERDNGHSLYYEQSGSALGKPVIFLHGGPGDGCTARDRRFHDPLAYRVVLLDQRGCGRSTYDDPLFENDLWLLLGDLEALRAFLGVERWQVFGGSWGSTLGLVYAASFPDRVTELVLRGAFLCRERDLAWYYREGAQQTDRWRQLLKTLPEAERHSALAALHTRLTATATTEDDRRINRKLRLLLLGRSSGEELLRALAPSRVVVHYLSRRCFLPTPNWILDHAFNIKIPVTIIHGARDPVCPVQNAIDLANCLKAARLHILPNAGHAADDPAILDALLQATDFYATDSEQTNRTKVTY